MGKRLLLGLLSVLISSIVCIAGDDVQADRTDQHTEVSMRMIGHRILLSLGDSTSRILPIERDADRYRIRFATEFSFNPDNLAAIIDSVVAATQIASSYIVAFESCETKETVHMYEIGASAQANVLACKDRDQPLGCYDLLFTITDPTVPDQKSSGTSERLAEYASADYREVHKLLAILLAVVAGLVGVVFFMLKRKPRPDADPNLTSIGEYLFNHRKMELSFKDERIELTSKESDLLQLLCASANDTVERDTILRTVWGDEGDYVGRTLDVFISKLRKKLEADANVKIANIRGIGYRLVVDENQEQR